MAKANYTTVEFRGFTIWDELVVNRDEFIPKQDSNPHNVRPFLFHDHGSVLGICFADCEQDALDILADSGKIAHLMIQEEEMDDYPDGVGIDYLGNNSMPFDVQNVEAIVLPIPRFSFTTLLIAELARRNIS